MPLYFFHLSGPEGCSRDDVGIEYPNVEAAYLGAHQAALDISLDLLRVRTDPNCHSFEIMDQDGEVLFELPFSEVMQPSRHARPPGDMHARIHLQRERAGRALSELHRSVERTRSLLAATRELLGRS